MSKKRAGKAQKVQTQDITTLTDSVKECKISQAQESQTSSTIVMSDITDLQLLSKWPKLRMKVPTIFLHKSADLGKHMQKIISLGVIQIGTNTKIKCGSFDDHKAIVKYLDNNKLPYHTFGHPSKRKMKVIVKGLPDETDLNKLKAELKSANIPVIRVHKMKKKDFTKKDNILVMIVVPYDDEGKKVLKVKSIFGCELKMEPPHPRTRQCHHCQKWGHSQRYCHGQVKCVKCGGDHMSTKCDRDAQTEPPKCANCGGSHTASYRQCGCCPDSVEYKQNLKDRRVKVDI